MATDRVVVVTTAYVIIVESTFVINMTRVFVVTDAAKTNRVEIRRVVYVFFKEELSRRFDVGKRSYRRRIILQGLLRRRQKINHVVHRRNSSVNFVVSLLRGVIDGPADGQTGRPILRLFRVRIEAQRAVRSRGVATTRHLVNGRRRV